MTDRAWNYQGVVFNGDGSVTDYYRVGCEWHRIPCVNNQEEAIAQFRRIGLRGGVFRHRTGLPAARDGWVYLVEGPPPINREALGPVPSAAGAMPESAICEKLWDMLDAIDTASDAFKDNNTGYRKMVSAICKLRHRLLAPNPDTEELSVVTVNYVCEHCGHSWVDGVLNYECPICDCPMGGDMRIPLSKGGAE